MKITRRGYYEVYRPDGSYVSRHTSRDESYEAITEDGQNGTYRIVCPDREVSVEGNDVGLVIGPPFGGGSGPSGDYTPTHYVAQYASVSGATSDWDTANGTAFSSATSISTPCTLGEAMANATAGNVIECAEGVYIGSTTGPGHRYLSDFMPTNSGTLGNPIIFFAKYPAATNHGSTSLYTELRKQNTEGSTLGAGGSDYIVFDGFYFDENYNLPANDGGILMLGSVSTGIEVRRCSFLRTGASATHGDYGTGDNKNPIFMHISIDSKVLDCRFEGDPGTGAHKNNAVINIYDSASYTIEHNLFTGNAHSIYHKESGIGGLDPAPYRQSGVTRYNHFYQCGIGSEVQQGITQDFSYNLFEGCTDNAIRTDWGPNRAGDQTWTFTNNTIVMPGTASGFYMEPNDDWTSGMVFQDNIIYATSGLSGGAGFVDSYADQGGDITQWDWTQWTIDNNSYYSPGTYAWYGRENDGGDNTLADWQTQTGQEANSITSDPEFVSVGSRNFRLASNGQAALTASSTGGPVGCYVTGTEEIGIRANPTY